MGIGIRATGGKDGTGNTTSEVEKKESTSCCGFDEEDVTPSAELVFGAVDRFDSTSLSLGGAVNLKQMFNGGPYLGGAVTAYFHTPKKIGANLEAGYSIGLPFVVNLRVGITAGFAPAELAPKNQFNTGVSVRANFSGVVFKGGAEYTPSTRQITPKIGFGIGF